MLYRGLASALLVLVVAGCPTKEMMPVMAECNDPPPVADGCLGMNCLIGTCVLGVCPLLGEGPVGPGTPPASCPCDEGTCVDGACYELPDPSGPCGAEPSPPECTPICAMGELCVAGMCYPTGAPQPDAGREDSGTNDAGEPVDAELDAPMNDATTPDASIDDAMTPDAATPDAATPDAGGADGGTCTLLDNGQLCTSHGECCSGNCAEHDNLPMACACVAPGIACGRNADCCNMDCVDGLCALSCGSADIICGGSINSCCADLACLGGRCRTRGMCLAQDEVCTSGADCCSGSCVQRNPMVPMGEQRCGCHDVSLPASAPTAVPWAAGVGTPPSAEVPPTGTIVEGLYAVTARELWGWAPPASSGPAVVRITGESVRPRPNSPAYLLEFLEVFPAPPFPPMAPEHHYTEAAVLLVSGDAGRTRIDVECASGAPDGTPAMDGRATFNATANEIVLTWATRGVPPFTYRVTYTAL